MLSSNVLTAVIPFFGDDLSLASAAAGFASVSAAVELDQAVAKTDLRERQLWQQRIDDRQEISRDRRRNRARQAVEDRQLEAARKRNYKLADKESDRLDRAQDQNYELGIRNLRLQEKLLKKGAKKGALGGVLGIVGGVVGGIYGGPAGATAGASAGSAIGQSIG